MLYQPIPQTKPVTRQRLIRNKARIVDAWREDGQLIQLYRMPNGDSYRGPADALRNAAAFQPVRPITD